MSIPGVTTYHPRDVWEPWAHPYTVASMNPPAQKPGMITQPVAHYTGAVNLIDGDPGEHAAGIPAYLGAIQRDYATRRGYSVGYLFAIDWLGGVWELRGFDYKAAANAGHNEYTCPILFLVDGADPVTDAAATSARAVWRHFRRRADRPDFNDRPMGHGQLFTTTGIGTPTACPGSGIQSQITAGYLDLDADRPPTTTPEDDHMGLPYFRIDGYADQFKPIAMSADSKARNGDTDVPVLVLDTDKSRAELELVLGYKLTPHTD